MLTLSHKPIEKHLQNGPHKLSKINKNICNNCMHLRFEFLDDTENYLITCELMQTNWMESWEKTDWMTPSLCPYLA